MTFPFGADQCAIEAVLAFCRLGRGFTVVGRGHRQRLVLAGVGSDNRDLYCRQELLLVADLGSNNAVLNGLQGPCLVVVGVDSGSAVLSKEQEPRLAIPGTPPVSHRRAAWIWGGPIHLRAEALLVVFLLQGLHADTRRSSQAHAHRGLDFADVPFEGVNGNSMENVLHTVSSAPTLKTGVPKQLTSCASRLATSDVRQMQCI